MPNQPRQRPQKRNGSRKTPSLYEAQRQRTLSQARREWLRAEEEEGKLVRREAVEKEVFKMCRQFRDTMQNVPARLAGLIAALSPGCNQDQIHVLLTKEIHACLEGLAAGTTPLKS